MSICDEARKLGLYLHFEKVVRKAPVLAYYFE